MRLSLAFGTPGGVKFLGLADRIAGRYIRARFSFGYEITSVSPGGDGVVGRRHPRGFRSVIFGRRSGRDVGDVSIDATRFPTTRGPGVVTLPPIARGALAIYVMHRSP